ncbi:haloalkane dehalogenase [Microbispora sp. CA-135349]|uniref:haloalkane dehalogenase n=1 Tax=Microbispora sp. CA-135349 TaxID=3239953 RepID=UPI003D8DF439
MIADRPDDRDDAPAPAVLTRRHMLGAGTAAAATGLLRLPPPARDGLPRSAPAPHTKVLRTPESRFRDLADYPFEPHYVHVDAGDGTGGRLRMHYVDERPAGAVKPSGQTILLLHGQPSWSYLYRHVIPPLVAAGHRCVAPDLVGFGRSDKPASRFAYTYQRHVDWLREALFDRLGLRDVTMVCHDWGGLLGLRLLAEHPGRFRRVVATDTYLPTGDQDVGRAFHAWTQYSQRADPFDAGSVVEAGTISELGPGVKAAYDAPFPDETYRQGARQFPLLVPITPWDEATVPNRDAWAVLRTLSTPFLCAFSDHVILLPQAPNTDDPGYAVPYPDQWLRERIPGAQGQPHTTITGAGHFVQEDQGPRLAAIVNGFVESTR